MSFINEKKVKQYFHEREKQISKDALDSLNIKVASILESAVKLTRNFKRVTPTEIQLAKGE